jgi:hypothetical protein
VLTAAEENTGEEANEEPDHPVARLGPLRTGGDDLLGTVKELGHQRLQGGRGTPCGGMMCSIQAWPQLSPVKMLRRKRTTRTVTTRPVGKPWLAAAGWERLLMCCLAVMEAG